ncbi:MAG TPA: hypothetical protein VN372_13765 [Methanospirillum sp.]|nr:hypothetical protein [Methanospirillum sp.]
MRSSIIHVRLIPFFIIVLLTTHAGAVPPLPAEFYGNVFLDGKPAPVGTSIMALINGVEKGSIQTSVEGFYGGPALFDTRLKVNVSEEEYKPGDLTVTFVINGQQSLVTADFEPGSSKQLDLAIGAGASPGGSLQTGAQPTAIFTPSITQNPESRIPSGPSDSGSTSSTVSYGLDQPKIFKSEDGLAEISFSSGTMLFSPDGQFLNAVGIRAMSISGLPPFPVNNSLQFTGYAYQVIPEGTYFNPKGTLTIRPPPDRAYAIISAGPVIYEFLPQTASWEPVETISNMFTNEIKGDIFEAGIYGLFGPSGINMTNLQVQNNISNISSAQSQIIEPPVLPMITPNQSIALPLITPLPPGSQTTGILPLTPLPTQIIEKVPELPPITNTSEISQSQGSPNETLKKPFTFPGLGLLSGVANAVKSRMTGPVIAIIGLLALFSIANTGIYIVYRYWWLKRS